MTSAERSKKLYHSRLEAGLCPRCGGPRDNPRNKSYCTACASDTLEDRTVGKSKYNLQARVKTNTIRLQILNYYGGKCQCCGEVEPAFLTIDHIHGSGNKHRKAIGNSGTSLARWLVKNNFPEGFQVLCRNCNWAKHILGTCPHQHPKE